MALEQLDLSDEKIEKKYNIKKHIKDVIIKNKKKDKLTQDDINQLVLKIAEFLDIEV